MNFSREPIVARFLTVAAAATAIVVLAPQPTAQSARANERWVGTWATAVVARAPLPPQRGTSPPGAPQAPAAQGRGGAAPMPPPNFNNQTIREIVHTSIGGDRVRVVFTNAYG